MKQKPIRYLKHIKSHQSNAPHTPSIPGELLDTVTVIVSGIGFLSAMLFLITMH